MKKILMLLAMAGMSVWAYAADETEAAEAPQPAPQPQSTVVQNNWRSDNLLHRADDTYYYNGRTMTRDEMAGFLQQNCPEAYHRYKVSSRLRKGGVISLSVGAPLMVAGLITMGVGAYQYAYQANTEYNYNMMCIGAGVAVVGSLGVEAGIPLLIVGTVRRNNAYEIYNEQCIRQAGPTFSIQANGNGLGLAMTF
ncbi:MAG: hypothetical protein J5808_07060 [Paludibacteraceae bacterium]|nr:hypothetical protein [Paludibacteraceae bacterium]